MRLITTRRRASLASIALAVCTALALVACGAKSDTQTDTSTSAGAASEASVPTVAYMPSKEVFDDGEEVMEHAIDYGDHGEFSHEQFSRGSETLLTLDISDWDEYGHFLAAKGTYVEDDTSTPMTVAVEIKTNEDGTLASETQTNTYEQEASYEEGEVASYTIEQTYLYADDVQVLSKFESKATYLDAKGSTIWTDTETSEFDDSGLEVRYTHEIVYATGERSTLTAEIVWTKDADGTPKSFELTMHEDGEEGPLSLTADVEVDESGLVSKISNFKADGQETGVTATIEHAKIDDPLPNAYEGWKSFSITDLLSI